MAGGGQGYAQGGQIGDLVNPQTPNTGYNMPYAGSNYAAPNQNFMAYPQQGAPNQPPMASPDMGGLAPNTNMGFDNSGSDAGVEGQPVNSMQSPMQNQNFGQPPMLSQYRPQQGLQVQGNPTSMPVQRPQQR